MCQLSASCIASVGIEGKVGNEIVGYGVADELTWYKVEVGNEEMRLRFLSVVHRIVEMTDVLGTVHDGAKLALGEVRNEEDDILHSSGKESLAAFRHLQFVTVEGIVGFGSREKEELPIMEGGMDIGSEVAKGGFTLDVAFLPVFGYEAQNVTPAVHAIEIPLSVIPGITSYATFCVG